MTQKGRKIMSTQKNETILYTVREVAALMHTNSEYVYKLIRTGLLPALKFKSIRVRKKALESFLEKYEGYDLSDINDIRPLVDIETTQSET